MAHQAAGGLWLILAVHLKPAQSFAGAASSVGTSRVRLHLAPVTNPTTSHGWFYTPSACPACLSMSFEIFPQEILNNLQFWSVLEFLCSLLKDGLFSLQMTSTFPESSPPHSATVLPLKALDFPFLSENKQR